VPFDGQCRAPSPSVRVSLCLSLRVGPARGGRVKGLGRFLADIHSRLKGFSAERWRKMHAGFIQQLLGNIAGTCMLLSFASFRWGPSLSLRRPQTKMHTK